jgi:hypothetical protein
LDMASKITSRVHDNGAIVHYSVEVEAKRATSPDAPVETTCPSVPA